MATELKATKREELGSRKVRRLRKEGKVPAIIYGHGEENVPVTLDGHDLTFATTHGERVLTLRIGRKKENVLIRELQYDTFGHNILHADLTRVNLDERVEVTVPIELRGTVEEGGILQQNIAEVSLRCLVTEIPEEIRASVNDMKVGDLMHLRDLTLPEGTELMDDPDGVVCSVVVIAEEEEVPAEEAEAAEEPEVISEAKPEEEASEPSEQSE